MGIKIEKIDFGRAEHKLKSLADDETMTQIHSQLATFLDPYVPMDEGILAGSTVATPKYLQYNSPYAHYMYTGIVYGPNIPEFDKNGKIIGYWSKPGETKHPTGALIQYNRDNKHPEHPLATREWDKAAMRDKGDVFRKDVETILKRKLKEGGNG